MSLVPSVARLPPALSGSYSDSESCSGHVFSMLSLQSNSGAGKKRPQAGPDMTLTFELQNESCAKMLNSFFGIHLSESQGRDREVRETVHAQFV